MTTSRTRTAWLVGAVGGLLVLGWLVVRPEPASAEVPAGDERSELTDPAASGDVRAEVVGGDEYLRLTVAPGHEVVVQGYAGEPYLRFRADGTVEQNERSPAVVLNTDRYGVADAPGPSDDEARVAPQWTVVSTDGSYQWHDHRIHSMVVAARPDGIVSEWQVPVSVDGAATDVRGVLRHEPSSSGLPWAVAIAALSLLAIAAGWRRSLVATRAFAVVSVVASIAIVVGERMAVGGALVGGVLGLLPPMLAVGAALVAVAGRTPKVQLAGAIGVPILEVGWLLARLTVLWRPVVVTAYPVWLQRSFVVVAVSAAIAGAVLALEAWRRLLADDAAPSATSRRMARGRRPGRSGPGAVVR